MTQVVVYFDPQKHVAINSPRCFLTRRVFGQTAEHEREFAMATASVGDSLGIALSSAASFPVHYYFCSL